MTTTFVPAPAGTDHTTLNPGQWIPWAWGVFKPYGRAALLGCPTCKRPILVGLQNHRILPDGTVRPSFVCTHKGCTYHQHIKLAGWT